MARIKEIEECLAGVDSLDHPLFAELSADQRSGVQQAIRKRRRALEAQQAEEFRLEGMLVYEKALYAQGLQLVAGVDEVGRGPLAGPVVAAAVILPVGCKIPYLNDSKKIPKSKHQTLYQEVMDKAVAVGIAQVDPSVIDQVNIYQATKLAMEEAISKLEVRPDHLLIDAMELGNGIPQTAIIKGDATSLSIAAASIVAKVTRDRLMADYDQAYPGYGFAKNAGYGTKEHLVGIERQGICPIHRKTFEPIRSLFNGGNV